MQIGDIKDHIIDQIWRKEHVDDQLLWDEFWSLTENEARGYAKERWFKDRDVTQNHITRKVKRFWPVIAEGVARVRGQLHADPSYPKVYRCYNYDYENGGTLGYVMAGGTKEAERLFSLFLPPAESERKERYYTEALIAPISDAQAWTSIQNSAIMGEVMEAIRERRRQRDFAIESGNAKVAKAESRLDALSMFMSSTGSAAPQEDEPAGDSSSEEVET